MNKDKKVTSLQELGKLMGNTKSESEFLTGKIEKYLDNKGFGFIKGEKGPNIFFHVTKVKNGTPKEEMAVKYKFREGGKGLEATEVILEQNNFKGENIKKYSSAPQKFYLPNDTKKIIDITRCENNLLYLNRFVEWEASKKNAGKMEPSNDFLEKMETKSFSDIVSGYSFKRHKNLIKRLECTHYLKEHSFTVDWRMVVGLGAENVHKTSMTLHHIYGIPYIPGSALKGIARDAAVADFCSETENEKPDVMDALISMPDFNETNKKKREKEINKCGKVKRQNGKFVEPEKSTIDKIIQGWPNFEKARKVFGGQKQAGKIIFFDAFPEKNVSIKLDIMNPHYPKYYSGDEAPTDWQNPNPIKFLTVENTSFNFALALNKKETDRNRNKIDSDPAMLDVAEKWLRKALEEHGVGAKTSIGYEYFSV